MRTRLILVSTVVLLRVALASGGAPDPLVVAVHPNLERARDEGFHMIVGHAPFTVDFFADVAGGQGTVSASWDFDADSVSDSSALDPEPFTYWQAGVYEASIYVRDELGREAVAKQRIVVIGPPDAETWRYGVVAHLNRSYGLYRSDGEVERAADMISELGIDIVRLDMAWASIQPTQTEYNWTDYDYLVDLASEHGFDLMPTIGFSSEWASTIENSASWEDWFFAAPSPEEYAWFAYQAASRYAGRIQAWEIWSEPNSGIYWRPEPDPAIYTKLLRSAYLAIKYANPAAMVILGGLANDESSYQPQFAWYPPEEFLQAVYVNGGGPYFDAVGRHPYTHPNEGISAFTERLEQLRSVMVSHGDMEKPIWLTEFGYAAAREAGVTNTMQGRWLTQCLDATFLLDYVQVPFWYNFRNKGSDASNWDNNYGLIEYDWSLKPAYEGYRAYIADE